MNSPALAMLKLGGVWFLHGVLHTQGTVLKCPGSVVQVLWYWEHLQCVRQHLRGLIRIVQPLAAALVVRTAESVRLEGF